MPSSDSLVSPDSVVQCNLDGTKLWSKVCEGLCSLKGPPTPSLTGGMRCMIDPLQAAQRQRMKGLSTWRVATRTHAFGKTKEPEERPLAASLGVWFFLPSFQTLLVTMRNESLSRIKCWLYTPNWGHEVFPAFFRKEKGSYFEFPLCLSSLPSVGRNAPGKACASSIGPGPTLVPCPEETWKYGQLYLKSQTSKSLCFTPKRKEWCLDFSERLISSQQHGFYLWFIYFCNIQCGKTYGEC